MSTILPESARQALEVAPPKRGSTYNRATVTSTEVFQIPSAGYWTFQAITTGVYIQFDTGSTFSITANQDSTLTGTTLAANNATGFFIPAGQERSFYVPANWYVGHESADTSGELNFYPSGGDGR